MNLFLAGFWYILQMGKTRREEKLARRGYEESLKSSRKFSWKKYFGVLAKTLPKVILVFVATLALQILLVSLGVKFFETVYGQLMLFVPAYIATMYWTRQSAKSLYEAPEKPDILKRR